MCNSRAYAFVFCMLFLTGCGENFTVGGVSLGGSGTGLGVPQTNTVLLVLCLRSLQEPYVEVKITYYLL